MHCHLHGEQPEAFVCQHVLAGMRERRRVGFFWTAEDRAGERPDAWCAACEERVRATGGDWVGDALEQLRPKLICGSCYDAARTFHLDSGTLG